MATTVNNTTVNSKVTIIFDAAGNLNGKGPAKGTGNTEADVYLDDSVYYNLRSHTEIDNSIHALQWDATTNSGEIEYVDTRDNLALSSFPQWATNVVIRCEAEDTWKTAYNTNVAAQLTTWTNGGNAEADFVEDKSKATTHADSERTTYLSAHSITY